MSKLLRGLGVAVAALGVACSSNDPAAPVGVAGVNGVAGASAAGASGSAGSGGMGLAAGAGGATAGAAGVATAGNAGSGGAKADDCAIAPNSLFCAPLGPLPASLKATGLFPAAPDLNVRSARLLEYVPDPPLWSDGMAKQRFLLLPAGKQIDNTNRQQWAFPDGTIMVKTFFDEGGAAGARRPIETRLIRAGSGGLYEFFVYQWNADATDATLVVNDIDGDLNAELPVDITIKTLNAGQPFAHAIPSRNACGKCHEQNGMVAQTFIGFDELRLNAKLDAAAAKTQLQSFADAGIFSAALPAVPVTITDTSADGGRLLRIKRFAFGNCVTCHNGQGQFDLHPDMLVANTVGKPTDAQSVMPPAGWLRVVPGDAAKSVLYVQMQRTMLPPEVDGRRLRAMPPVGLADVAVEQTVLKDVFDWIGSLK